MKKNSVFPEVKLSLFDHHLNHSRPDFGVKFGAPQVAMRLEFVTYNGNMDMFSHASVKLELQPTGLLDSLGSDAGGSSQFTVIVDVSRVPTCHF